MRCRLVLPFAALLVLSVLGSAFLSPASAPNEESPPADRVVQPDGTRSYVWPYTSRSRSVGGRTLAINVVVHGNASEVQRALLNRSEGNWTGIDGDAAVGNPAWRPARGAARYTYVASDQDAGGRWTAPEYQLGAGAYLGQRVHVRAYPGPSSNWTAIQAHTEYWDWFRLRHTVTGTEPGARAVERDLRNKPLVGEISRVHRGPEGGGNGGWLTGIIVAPTALLVGVALSLSRGDGRWRAADVALPGAIVALVLGVRAAGLAAEELLPGTNPKAFAAVLYPVLAVGPPLVVLFFARNRPAARTAALAAAALGTGIVLDFGGVGVASIPLPLLFHRSALIGALGVLALGVAREDRRLIVVGALAWVGVLAASLLDLL